MRVGYYQKELFKNVRCDFGIYEESSEMHTLLLYHTDTTVNKRGRIMKLPVTIWSHTNPSGYWRNMFGWSIDDVKRVLGNATMFVWSTPQFVRITSVYAYFHLAFVFCLEKSWDCVRKVLSLNAFMHMITSTTATAAVTAQQQQKKQTASNEKHTYLSVLNGQLHIYGLSGYVVEFSSLFFFGKMKHFIPCSILWGNVRDYEIQRTTPNKFII